MKNRVILFFVLFLLLFAFLFSACKRQKNVCPPTNGTLQPKPELADLITLPPPVSQDHPIEVEIGGEVRIVDKLADYPMCNDEWSGTVYVSCDAQVAQAQSSSDDNPLFFKGCNLKIEPGTIVYVAAHNDAAYYKGCSCHTGNPTP